MTFNRDDCRVEQIAPESRGGQHAGLPPSKVKVTHAPSGISAVVESRSHHKSREIAMEMVEYGVLSLK